MGKQIKGKLGQAQVLAIFCQNVQIWKKLGTAKKLRDPLRGYGLQGGENHQSSHRSRRGHTWLWSIGRWYLALKYGISTMGVKVFMFDGKKIFMVVRGWVQTFFVHIWEMHYWGSEIFPKNILTQWIFELGKYSFFYNWVRISPIFCRFNPELYGGFKRIIE